MKPEILNFALVTRFARESALLLLCSLIGIVTFGVIFVGGMQSFGPQLIPFLSSVDFLRDMLEMAFSIRLEGDVSSNILYAIVFLHPFVLALSWGFLIAITTRITIGEINNGTADLLLALPISRVTVLVSAAAVWVVSAVAISFAPLIGVWIGSQIWEPTEPIQFGRFFVVSICFCMINFVVAGLSTLASCVVQRRGHAIAVVVGLALVSIAMNFLEPFLPFIERIRFVNLLNYYRPSVIVREGVWPVAEVFTLAVSSVMAWSIGLYIYLRKDIPTA